MQIVAINWHVYTLLRGESYVLSLGDRSVSIGMDALALGALGLVRVVPIILFALFGGLLADLWDRRRVMIATQSMAALVATALAALTLSGNEGLSALYLLTALGAATKAFDTPARQSIVPNLVDAKDLTNAVSLNTLLFQIGTIVGPAVAGLLIARFDIGVVYAIDALSFMAVLAALLAMRHRGTPKRAVERQGWSALTEGFRFVRQSRIIWSTMLLDFIATFFGSARLMLPIVAAELLGVGEVGYGLLSTAQPVGAVMAGLITALRKDIYHQGRILLISVAIYGAATAFFGLTTIYALSYLFFALTGAADTVSTVIRGTIRQVMTPDHLRGRMTGINMIFFMGGPQLGELEAGIVAAFFGVPFAISSGGVAVVLLTAWIAWRYPRLRDYTSATEAALLADAGNG